MSYNPRVSNGHRRRELRARILREENICYLCGGEVDTKLGPGLPSSPEVHEVIPISKGGDPLDRNGCALTHRLCNQKYGAGPRPGAVTFVTTRTWTV
jgi:hypothetical protein